MPRDARRRQVQHPNDVIKPGYSMPKRPTRPTRGLRSLGTACATIAGFEGRQRYVTGPSAVRSRALETGRGAIPRTLPGVAGEAHPARRSSSP
jgi:hypothetical protein